METLPDTLLCNIFSYSKSLKDLSLVCKKFEALISNSSELMIQLPLVLREKMITEKFEEIMRSNRRYQAVIIRFDYKFSENGMNILTKFAQSIICFEAIRCIFTLDQFRSILELFPNLDNLHVNATFMQSDNNEIEPLPAEKIKNLKKFTFRSSDERIFELISHSKLRMINILSVKPECRRFEDFFVGQKCLKIIDGSLYFSNKIFECFPNFNYLKEVTLEMDKLMFTQLPTILSQSVSKLNLYGTAENNSQPLSRILNVFPNLKTLTVTQNRELSLANFSSGSLSNLSITDCQFSKNFKFNLIEIPTLKTFEFDKIEEIEDWKIFARKNPNIQELILKQNYVEHQDHQDAEILSPDLRERVLNIDDLVTEEKLKLFTGKLVFRNLKILRLLVKFESPTAFVLRKEDVKKQFHDSGILLFLK